MPGAAWRARLGEVAGDWLGICLISSAFFYSFLFGRWGVGHKEVVVSDTEKRYIGRIMDTWKIKL
ncbi:hypothetical protein M6B38_190075 [Iris pallida]|uniref:Uncharacterized protein n=1 Tax=Iris pallida TaxID=29817 RepID=A0AAX6EFS1_IRIPA|nr:hypothetical protein M6B38_190075 [Iris pallida]